MHKISKPLPTQLDFCYFGSMATSKTISVFEYLDYREYLKDFYAAHKKTRVGFSLRRFSEKAGFGSSNFFKLVMDGDRNLTSKSILKFCKGLDLNKQEKDFFTNLVHFTQAETHESKNTYYQKILQSRAFNKLKPLEKEHYEYYSQWHHSVIRELVTSKKFNGDLQWIANKVTPKITIKEIEKSIQLLESLGFIYQDENKNWQQVETLLSSGAECRSIALMNLHKNILNLVHNEITLIPPEKRDVSALVLGIQNNKLSEFKKKIQEFRKEILKMVSTEDHAEDVILLAIQLIPLTKTEVES